jgi:hypothetical protein
LGDLAKDHQHESFALDHLSQGVLKISFITLIFLTGAAMARGRVEGIKWLGRSMSGIGGILLYTFTSSYSNIPRFISAKID